jgi:hypothetical protein
LDGREAWYLTLKENRWRMFENRVPRGIFGTKREEMVGGWRKLCDELCRLYSSTYLISMIN